MKKLIKCPTCVTCNTSSILDHVPDSFPKRISQSGVIDVGVSDHQLLYCTRKPARSKNYCHKQTIFRSYKKYFPEIYKEALRKISIPNYELFDDIDTAYENFIQKGIAVIGNLVPSKNKRIKGISQNWFDAEILENLSYMDKLSKKFKKSCLHVDKDNYNEARNEVQKLIHTKKERLLWK